MNSSNKSKVFNAYYLAIKLKSNMTLNQLVAQIVKVYHRLNILIVIITKNYDSIDYLRIEMSVWGKLFLLIIFASFFISLITAFFFTNIVYILSVVFTKTKNIFNGNKKGD